MQLTRRGRLARSAAVTVAVTVAVVALSTGGEHRPRRHAAGQRSASLASTTVATTPTPVPSVRPSPATATHAARIAPTRLRPRPTGRLHVLAGHGPVRGHGPLERYRLAVEGGLGVDSRTFARLVGATLGNGHGWGHDHSFQRVSAGRADFTVVLASADLTDRLCAPADTHGRSSCFNHGRAVIDVFRWTHGAASYGWRRHLAGYRDYVVSHEVGHALGYGHLYRCRPDGLAPTMMQQTYSLRGCRRNPWPYP